MEIPNTSKTKQHKRQLIVAIHLLVGALSIGSLRAQNIVQDPGFEQGTRTSEGWNVGSGKNGAERLIDSEESHSGKTSLLLQQSKPLVLPEESKTAPSLLKFIGEKTVSYTHLRAPRPY